jgi:glucose/arabinose dehydrogenase
MLVVIGEKTPAGAVTVLNFSHKWLRARPSDRVLKLLSVRKSVYALACCSMGALLFVPTSAEGSTSWPQVTLTLYASGLQQPVHLTHAGDGSGRVFAVEQGGRIYILSNGHPLDSPFLDISHCASCCGEQGLLSIAFPPQYQQKQYFYVNYTDTAGDTVVARYAVTTDLNIADANSEEVVLIVNQPFANHNGGQLAFGPDGFLYIGMGDGGGGGDPQENGQNPLSWKVPIVTIVSRVTRQAWYSL